MKDLYSIKKILTELKPELEKNFHVSSIGIFGSVARNESSSESDVDIVVDFDQPIGISFIECGSEVQRLVGQEVFDLFVFYRRFFLIKQRDLLGDDIQRHNFIVLSQKNGIGQADIAGACNSNFHSALTSTW